MTIPPFAPSKQQEIYFSWIKNGSGSCVLEAVAGSGKTTTLIMGLTMMSGSIFFGAYNKKIAQEIEDKVKFLGITGVDISTLHSAGFKIWRRVARNVKVETNKCRNIFRDACSRFPNYKPFEGQVLSLVSYAKQSGLGALGPMNAKQSWMELVEHFDIDCEGQDDLVINLARKTLERSIQLDYEQVDFDDMIYAPLYHKVRAYEYDWVLIDEAQDTNASRRALSLLMLKRGGRLIAVGDRHQAIYGFTGADSNALDLIAEAVDAQRLPLTVSYRCPKKVVAYAQKFVSHIEAAETAIDGEVTFAGDGFSVVNNVKPGDAVLCRFNAPLITLAYQFISKGIAAKVEGREIGNGLKSLARRWKVKSFGALQDRLAAYSEREVAKFRIKEQESKAAAVEDRVTCLNLLIERIRATNATPANPVELLCEEIDKIFGDDVGSEFILLSTIHKAKGREWNNVYWLDAGASKWARKDWELEQENNLYYVAATRAKLSLTIIPWSK